MVKLLPLSKAGACHVQSKIASWLSFTAFIIYVTTGIIRFCPCFITRVLAKPAKNLLHSEIAKRREHCLALHRSA